MLQTGGADDGLLPHPSPRIERVIQELERCIVTMARDQSGVARSMKGQDLKAVIRNVVTKEDKQIIPEVYLLATEAESFSDHETVRVSVSFLTLVAQAESQLLKVLIISKLVAPILAKLGWKLKEDVDLEILFQELSGQVIIVRDRRRVIGAPDWDWKDVVRYCVAYRIPGYAVEPTTRWSE